MRVDFYQLSRDPADVALVSLARATLSASERLLVVAGDTALLKKIDTALWTQRPESFLAHGFAGGPDDERQPILLSDLPEPANGARYIALADGRWRDEALKFERVFLLFDAATIEDARARWRALDAVEGAERNYWEQVGGKWERRA
jgi:DNA polymerase-3 subunit chi